MNAEPEQRAPDLTKPPSGERNRAPRRMTGGEFRWAVAQKVAKSEVSPSSEAMEAFWARLSEADPFDDDQTQTLADEWVKTAGPLFGDRRPILIVEPPPEDSGSRLAAMGYPYYTSRSRFASRLGTLVFALWIAFGLTFITLGLLGKVSLTASLLVGASAPFVGSYARLTVIKRETHRHQSRARLLTPGRGETQTQG